MIEKHPKIPGFIDDYPSTTRILCPHCACLHRHGRGPGWRVPHCGQPGKAEYYIALVDRNVPQEAVQIDREARRRTRVLRNRRFANYRNRPQKPDILYETELAYLASSARELNRRVLAGEPLEEDLPKQSAGGPKIFLERRNRDTNVENHWYRECCRRGIPFIVVRQKSKFADVHYDGISLPGGTGAFESVNMEDLLRCIFHVLKQHGIDNKSRFFGGVICGTLSGLWPDEARKAAEKIYALHCQCVKTGGGGS